jgi:hypothetical protein
VYSITINLPVRHKGKTNTTMETLPNSSETTSNKPELNRRRFLRLGAGALGGLLMAGSVLKQDASANDHDDRSDRSFPPFPKPDLETEATPEPGDSSETIRLLAESDPDKLFEAFQITTEKASTPEEFAEQYAARLEMALNSGCTPEEVAHYLETGDRGYEDQMGDKYDLAIVRGLYGIPSSVSDDEVKSHPDHKMKYDTFVIAHKATLQRYLYASNVGITGQKVEVCVDEEADKPIIDKGEDDGMRLLTINLNVTDHYGEFMNGVNSYDIHAPFTGGVDFSTESGVCEVSMDYSVRALFDQIAAQN